MTMFEAFMDRRGIEHPSVPLNSAGLAAFLGFDDSPTAGVAVTPTGSLAMSSVYRAVSLISSVSASLPLHAYMAGTRNRAPQDPLWAMMLGDVDGGDMTEWTPGDVWRLSYVHRLLWGNSYGQKIRHKIRAQGVRELHPLFPGRMAVARYRPSEGIPGNKLFRYTDEWGTEHVLTSREVLHIPALGYDGVVGCSPIRFARQTISMALAAEKSSAKFFAQGAMLSGVLQVEQRLNDDAADKLKARWKAKISGSDNHYDIAVLDNNAKFTPITMPLKDAQFLETRKFSGQETGRFFGVPPFLMMDTERSTSWGTGLEQQALGWVKFDLHPTWLTPTEERVTREIVPTKEYAKYELGGLLRGDSVARAEFYRVMREVGAFSANDIRDREDEPPVAGGDTYLQPLNMAPLGAPPTPAPGGNRSGSADTAHLAELLDEVSAERDELGAERDALARQLAAVTAERDQLNRGRGVRR